MYALHKIIFNNFYIKKDQLSFLTLHLLKDRVIACFIFEFKNFLFPDFNVKKLLNF